MERRTAIRSSALLGRCGRFVHDLRQPLIELVPLQLVFLRRPFFPRKHRYRGDRHAGDHHTYIEQNDPNVSIEERTHGRPPFAVHAQRRVTSERRGADEGLTSREYTSRDEGGQVRARSLDTSGVYEEGRNRRKLVQRPQRNRDNRSPRERRGSFPL